MLAKNRPYCAPEEREVVQKGDRGVKPYRLLTLVKEGNLLCKLLDGKGEVGVGERLVFQREVPPFCMEGLETVTHHGITENHAVQALLFGKHSIAF